MHELGVVFYVIKDVAKVAAENNVHHVNSVTLEIGEVSGILHEYLIDCWNWARKKEPCLLTAELKIETIPAVTFCQSCTSNYETVKYGKKCPNCGSDDTYLITGNQFMIKEITVPDDDSEYEAAVENNDEAAEAPVFDESKYCDGSSCAACGAASECSYKERV